MVYEQILDMNFIIVIGFHLSFEQELCAIS